MSNDELSRAERDLWCADLRNRSFKDAMTAVMGCRKRLDWLPTAHQFEVEYQDALGRRQQAERDEQRALAAASIVPAPAEVRKRHMAEIRKNLAGAKGPLARGLRDTLGGGA